ncbi:MAG: PAS domain-containing protein [Nostoc sp.]|uniref:PAS domain-containing protein n=1 Tax=Nostoc sp. TaxID=1180 RepID=UPI002FFB530D
MSHLSCLTILLIDDCAEDRVKLCHLLQQDSLYTYRILEFETATQARKWCQQEIPDIILLDFLLPDGDGLKFIQQFQEYHSHTETAVIMLIEQGDEITDVRAMKSAVQDYLLKDKLTAEVLQGAIHHAVERMYLTRQLEQSREQQQLIAAIALRIRQSVKLEEILRTTATEVRQFLKADRVVVYQFQPDMRGTIVAESVLAGWTVAVGKQILDSCFQQTGGSDYRQGKKRVIDDIYQAGLTSCHLHLLEQFEVKANLVVPILVKEQLWGLLIAHQCSGSRHWQSVELDLLDQLAVQIAIAIQQGSVYQQAQTELAERQRTEAALKASEEKLATTQRIAHLGSWEFDFHTQELIWSEEVFQIFGRDPASGTPTYQEFYQSIHPNDRHIHDVLVQQTIKQGKFYEEEYRSYRPDGNLIYLLSKGKVIFDANGQPIQLIGILVDITARKQAEAALRDSERRYATLAQAAPVAIFRLDAFGNCIYINDRWSEMTGRPTEAALGMGWLQAFDPEDRDRLGREWSLKFEQGYPREFYQSEGTHLRPDGCINWFYIQILPESNPFGNIIGYIGTLTDITARKQAESALKESERRYATLAEAAPVGIFRLDNAGNCVYVNDRWSEMTGRSTEAPLGMGWAETLHPEDRDRILREWHEAELGQTGLFCNEGRHLRPDGSINWFYCCIKPETNATGTVSGYIGTLTDISIRKQVEEQLNALSERLTIAISSGGFGIWEYDFVQTKMIWDDRMYELHGISNTDFSGSFDAWLNCLHPDDRAYMLATIEQVVQAKQEYDVEFRIVEPSGKIRFLKGYGVLKRDPQGEPVRMIGVNYDISDRKQAEQELIHNRDLREAIFNESADAIFLVDPQRLVTLDCNRRAAELFEAIDKAELININGQTLQLRPFPASETDAIVTDMQLKGVWSREIEYVTLQGKIFWGNIAAKPITVAGRTMHLVRITDISERKQAEAQLRQTNEQLANANVELARATRLKDEFLANMSHELRTPLNAILGMSEGLQESVFGSINERQAKAIATIERSGRHLLELINDILDLSKIESGKLELQLSDVSVRNLCDISLAFVKQMALKKNIRLSTHISDNIDSIQVDDRRLRQVLINLLSNAVKFTPERGSVTLEVCRGEVNSALFPLSSSSPDICFQIADTGIGIAPEEIGKLFQPFIQLDSSLNRQYSGTGLGLALVQKLISLHGGTVLVSSEVGKGSCFTVRIPYHTSDNLLRTQVTTSLPSYPLLAENAQVLIIEDSVTAADQITRYFSEMGMQSIIYSQGEGAVEEVLRVQPAVIILDLQLPNLSGWEVLNQLKTNPKTKDIPAIIISVVDEHSKGLAQGAFEYLVKPITRAQLQLTIEKLQHPGRSDSPNLIVVPEVFVDTPLILLAEDNQANIDTMSAYLESRGYDLILANNGQQAIDLVRVQRPDLIVMDIQMPGMDGLEAIRRIRNDQQFMHIPMIALTALAMPGDRETSLTAGANEYLTKPVKLKQLVTTIQQLLGR